MNAMPQDRQQSVIAGMIERLPYGSSIRDRLDAYSIPEPNSGCWLWLGTTVKGYGRIWIDNVPQLAHRASYETYVGPIPEGLFARHRCDTKPCINPEHIVPGTRQDSADDMVKRGRGNHYFGEKARRVKLTDSTAQQINDLLLEGKLSCRGIGEIFGVSGACIESIRSGLRWGHITGASPGDPVRRGRPKHNIINLAKSVADRGKK